jgi:hypothetical protein
MITEQLSSSLEHAHELARAGVDVRLAGGVVKRGHALGGDHGGGRVALQHLEVEQAAAHVVGGDGAGVVVGLLALLLGPVVPSVAALGGEPDQGVGVEPVHRFL